MSSVRQRAMVLAMIAVYGAATNATATIISNGSFEDYRVPTSQAAEYNPPDASWNFNDRSGILFNNGVTFDPPSGDFPDGTQAAILQYAPFPGEPGRDPVGEFSQNITLPADGTYNLTYQVAGRNGRSSRPYDGDLTYSILLDSTLIGSDATTTFQPFTSKSVDFSATSGNHTLAFRATNSSGDHTGFFDQFSLMPPCSVSPVPPGEPPENPFNLNDLDPVLRQRLINLENSVGAANFHPNQDGGGRRSMERQAHLFNIAETFQALKSLGMVDGPPVGNFTQLELPPNPSADVLACEAVMSDTNTEVVMHQLSDPTPYSGVAPAGFSKHERGLAADVTITNHTDDEIRDLAFDAGLWRPLWELFGNERERHHFELFESAPPDLTPIIQGESPINLLIEDPEGRRIGFDPATGQNINEIGEGAYYSGAGSEPQVIVVPALEVLSGDYRVTGVGTGEGPYTLRRQLVVDHDPTNVLVDTIFATGIAMSGVDLNPVQVQLVIPEPSSFVLLIPVFVTLICIMTQGSRTNKRTCRCA